MHTRQFPLHPSEWMHQLFSARAATAGGIIRRKRADIDRIVGTQRFLDEVERRGFRALEAGDQIIIVCNTDPIRILR